MHPPLQTLAPTARAGLQVIPPGTMWVPSVVEVSPVLVVVHMVFPLKVDLPAAQVWGTLTNGSVAHGARGRVASARGGRRLWKYRSYGNGLSRNCFNNWLLIKIGNKKIVVFLL